MMRRSTEPSPLLCTALKGNPFRKTNVTGIRTKHLRPPVLVLEDASLVVEAAHSVLNTLHAFSHVMTMVFALEALDGSPLSTADVHRVSHASLAVDPLSRTEYRATCASLVEVKSKVLKITARKCSAVTDFPSKLCRVSRGNLLAEQPAISQQTKPTNIINISIQYLRPGAWIRMRWICVALGLMATDVMALQKLHPNKLGKAVGLQLLAAMSPQDIPQSDIQDEPASDESIANAAATAFPIIIASTDTLPRYSASNLALWPCNDALDKRILSLALPAILNFAIVPLVGLVDTYWVGRMSDPLALAGQGAANQLFSSAFWVLSFFPSVVTPLVAKMNSAGESEGLRRHVGEALLLGSLMGTMGTVLLVRYPHLALNVVLPPNAPVRAYAVPYLSIRGLTFMPALMSTICFSVYRGTLDVVSPLRIAIVANLVNIVLDPLFIFSLNKGVAGAAVATCISEVVSFLLYIRGMVHKDVLRFKELFVMPKWESVKPLVVGGLAVQLRGIALNAAFLAVTRTTQSLDNTGTAAAAHAITSQLWQLGGVFLLAISSTASMLVPSELSKAGVDTLTARRSARATADRLLRWGVVLGAALCCLQLLALPLLKVFSPLESVHEAARLPSIVGALLQIINGVVFIGEGIQQGNQAFEALAFTTFVASAGMITSLKLFGTSLAGVWASFVTFNLIRLAGVLHHHFIGGPLAPAKLTALAAKQQ